MLSSCGNLPSNQPTAKSGYKLVHCLGNGVFEVPTTWTSDAPANGDTADMKIENGDKGIIEVHLVSKQVADKCDYTVWLPIVDFTKTGSSNVTIDGKPFRKDTFTCKDAAGATPLMSAYVGDDTQDMCTVIACYARQPADLAEMEKVAEGYRNK